MYLKTSLGDALPLKTVKTKCCCPNGQPAFESSHDLKRYDVQQFLLMLQYLLIDPCEAVDACKAPYSICTSVQSSAVCSCPTCPDGQPVFEVCGSNKKTYRSACLLRRESCITNVIITVRPRGECRGRLYSIIYLNTSY